jgi:hypothetical protein
LRSRLAPAVLAAAALAAATLAGCAADSGPERTERREVGSFHAIELRGAARMRVEAGKAPSLSITASERVLQGTHIEVRDGVLVILVRERGGWFQRGPAATLVVQAPALDSVQISGAGDFTLQDISGSRLDIVFEGAGSLEASGTVGTMSARLDGAGRADLGKLAATDAKVAVNGAGRLDLQVTGTLTAEVNGVGSITYSGNPQKVVPAVHGVGSISPAAGT